MREAKDSEIILKEVRVGSGKRFSGQSFIFIFAFLSVSLNGAHLGLVLKHLVLPHKFENDDVYTLKYYFIDE